MNRYVISSKGNPAPSISPYELDGVKYIQIGNDFWGGDNYLHMIEATDDAIKKLKNAGWDVTVRKIEG